MAGVIRSDSSALPPRLSMPRHLWKRGLWLLAIDDGGERGSLAWLSLHNWQVPGHPQNMWTGPASEGTGLQAIFRL